MNTIALIFIFIVMMFLIFSQGNCGCSENFVGGPGVGKSFSFYHHPDPPCHSKDNCFRGSYVYYRS